MTLYEKLSFSHMLQRDDEYDMSQCVKAVSLYSSNSSWSKLLNTVTYVANTAASVWGIGLSVVLMLILH